MAKWHSRELPNGTRLNCQVATTETARCPCGLRAERPDFFEEPFEAGGCDETHQSARGLAKVTVSVRESARGENRRALLRRERLPTDGPLVFAFEDLEGLVLAMMDVRRRPAARQVVRFDHSQ